MSLAGGAAESLQVVVEVDFLSPAEVLTELHVQLSLDAELKLFDLLLLWIAHLFDERAELSQTELVLVGAHEVTLIQFCL